MASDPSLWYLSLRDHHRMRDRVDIAAWLRELGLERYEEAFRENEIDAAVLPRLTAEDLTSIGVAAIGHRRKLVDAIAALRTGHHAPTSAPPVGDRPAIAAPALPEGERRQVAVLFADLAGYPALSQEIDAEEVHALLGRFFERADRKRLAFNLSLPAVEVALAGAMSH
jgi:class 3 adenylate cyclase